MKFLEKFESAVGYSVMTLGILLITIGIIRYSSKVEKSEDKVVQESNEKSFDKPVKIRKRMKKTNPRSNYFYKNLWSILKFNECGKLENCCNKLQYDIGGFTCYGLAELYFSKTLNLFKSWDATKKQELIKVIASSMIYSTFYLKPKIDQLDEKWQPHVLDYAVHDGASDAIRTLQRVLKTKADGKIGRKTLAKAKRATLEDILLYNKLRIMSLKKRKGWKHFHKHWTLRVNILNSIIKKEIRRKEDGKNRKNKALKVHA